MNFKYIIMVLLTISIGINIFFLVGKGINITNNHHVHQEQYQQQAMLSIGLFAVQGHLGWKYVNTHNVKFIEKFESLEQFLMTLSLEQSLMAKITRTAIYYPVIEK